jgi:uncharacterized protein YciI
VTSWFVLQHTPGSVIPEGESVFDQPGITEHFAFLKRRADAGQLIAAGPIDDDSGDGITVLELDDLDEAIRLATEDDAAVAAGLLTVTVRPWRVVMAR